LQAAAAGGTIPRRLTVKGRRVDPDHFEELVEESLEGLPPEFAARLENVDVEVEVRPSRRTLRQMGLLGRGTLLGLYHGIPQTRRTSDYGNVLPDRIVIYREPVLKEAEAVSDEESENLDAAIRKVVRQTVLHEIGHHFGLSDDELRRLDY
jgi:predicted Zn-dependent protease with MMP-like domain